MLRLEILGAINFFPICLEMIVKELLLEINHIALQGIARELLVEMRVIVPHGIVVESPKKTSPIALHHFARHGRVETKAIVEQEIAKELLQKTSPTVNLQHVKRLPLETSRTVVSRSRRPKTYKNIQDFDRHTHCRHVRPEASIFVGVYVDLETLPLVLNREGSIHLG